MDAELQRGVLQLISGTCWLTFGAILLGRSIKKHGLVWPLRWHMLSGLAMSAAGYVQLAHGAYWIDWLGHELFSWRLIVPLWVQTVATVWTFYRWVRDPEEER